MKTLLLLISLLVSTSVFAIQSQPTRFMVSVVNNTSYTLTFRDFYHHTAGEHLLASYVHVILPGQRASYVVGVDNTQATATFGFTYAKGQAEYPLVLSMSDFINAYSGQPFAMANFYQEHKITANIQQDRNIAGSGIPNAFYNNAYVYTFSDS